MADENDYYASVVRYRATMPRRVRTPDAEYTARLEHCRTCPSLNAGTCMQCGCYVEMRAARTDMHCPLDNAPGNKPLYHFPPHRQPPGAGFFVCKGSILLFCCNIMPLSPLYPPFSFVIITIC